MKAIGDRLAFDVELPQRVEPAKRSFELACRALTFQAPPEIDASPHETRVLRAGARLSNGSVEVGQLRAAKGDEVDLYDVQLLETKGGRARIKIAGDNPLTVWVDARDIDAEVAADPSTASA